MKLYKQLLVCGTPRSGTAWYSKVLKSQGVKVKHESMGEDGTVSGLFFGDHPWYPYKHEHNKERRQDYHFGEVKLLVRDPLKTIPSLSVLLSYSDNVPARKWYSEVFNMSLPPAGDNEKLIPAAAEIWSKSIHYIMNNEQLDDIMRFEDLLEVHGDISRPNGTFIKAYKEPLTWEKLDAMVGEDLAMDILDLSCIFGYEEGDRCIL